MLSQVKDLPEQIAIAGLCVVFLALVGIKAGLAKGSDGTPPSA